MLTKNQIIKKSSKGAVILLVFLILQYGVSFVGQVFLARLLPPEVFGQLAISFFITMIIMNLFNTQGDKYLIQYKGKIDEQLASIISFEIYMSLLFFLLIIFSAPYLAKLANRPQLTFAIQFLALIYLTIPFSKLRVIYEKDISMFKAKGPATLAQILSTSIAIYLAYKGYGLWSLLIWRVTQYLFESVVLLFISGFKVKLTFKFAHLTQMYKFSLPLIGSTILVFFIWNVDYYIVGYIEGDTQLGYYWLAFQASHYFLSVKNSINSVLFPTFSKLTSIDEKIGIFNKFIRITTVIYIVPAIFILLFGQQIILYIYGTKWLPAVIPFKIFFVIVLIRAIGGNAGPFLYSLGKTIQDFNLGVLNAILLPAIVIPFTYLWGIDGASIGVFLSALVMACYGFHYYITPLTKNNLIFYYGKPLLAIILFAIISISIPAFLHNLSCLIVFVELFLTILIFLILFKSDIVLLKKIIHKTLSSFKYA